VEINRENHLVLVELTDKQIAIIKASLLFSNQNSKFEMFNNCGHSLSELKSLLRLLENHHPKNISRLFELIKETYKMTDWALGNGYGDNPIYKNLNKMINLIDNIQREDV
jgi:hypothetical protein